MRRGRAIGWRRLATIAVAAAGVWAFVAVSDDVLEQDTHRFDAAVRRWILAHRIGAGGPISHALEWAGDAIVMASAALVAAAWLWWRRGRHAAAGVVLAPAVAVLLYNVAKFSVGRARPAGAAARDVLTYAFPSGHAVMSAAVCGTLAYVFYREGVIRAWLALPLAVVAPVVMGLSRVYLDMHWATDVIGGWSAGVVIAALSAMLYERLAARAAESRRKGG